MRIEEVINEILGSAAAVVTALPDEQRGEKLIVFYTHNGINRDELWNRLNQSALPKLWIPRRENLFSLESIPLLGSGKIDLRQIKALAYEQTAKSH
jgi:Acyl-CoA synthetases (AMP-forming)/AMP-acid ligases II